MELDNLEEEEELEELEDGHCHDDDDSELTDSREASPLKVSSLSDDEPPRSPKKQRFVHILSFNVYSMYSLAQLL